MMLKNPPIYFLNQMICVYKLMYTFYIHIWYILIYYNSFELDFLNLYMNLYMKNFLVNKNQKTHCVLLIHIEMINTFSISCRTVVLWEMKIYTPPLPESYNILQQIQYNSNSSLFPPM